MNKRLAAIAAIVSVFVLCLCLTACAVDKTQFIGTWAFESGSEEGLDSESVELMKTFGLEATLTLAEDETGTLNLFGEETPVTWSAKSSTEGTLSLESMGDASMKIDDGRLVLEDKGTSMTFKRV